jgi:hypothetical protein
MAVVHRAWSCRIAVHSIFLPRCMLVRGQHATMADTLAAHTPAALHMQAHYGAQVDSLHMMRVLLHVQVAACQAAAMQTNVDAKGGGGQVRMLYRLFTIVVGATMAFDLFHLHVGLVPLTHAPGRICVCSFCLYAWTRAHIWYSGAHPDPQGCIPGAPSTCHVHAASKAGASACYCGANAVLKVAWHVLKKQTYCCLQPVCMSSARRTHSPSLMLIGLCRRPVGMC